MILLKRYLFTKNLLFLLALIFLLCNECVREKPEIAKIQTNNKDYIFAGDLVTFSATFSTDIEPKEYSWDFGDGENSMEKEPSHVYTEPGDYNVYLIASNSVGSDEDSITLSIYDPDESGKVYFWTNDTENVKYGTITVSITGCEDKYIGDYHTNPPKNFVCNSSLTYGCAVFYLPYGFYTYNAEGELAGYWSGAVVVDDVCIGVACK